MTTAIDFQLDKLQNSGRITYRPFGVRAIKLKVSSPTKDQPALRLRAGRRLDQDVQEGTFRGFPAGTEALMVSWGGGHEPGPCVKPKDFLKFKEEPAKLPKGEKSYIYFNLTHIKPAELPEEASLTIEAYEPGLGGAQDRLVSRLDLTIERPDPLPDEIRGLKATAAPDGEEAWMVSDGRFLPAYDPRWWPGEVAWVDELRPLPLTIRRRENRLELFWDDAAEALAVVTDKTEPSLLVPGDHQSDYRNTVLFELFNFDDNHVALRIWFYWLNKQIGGNFFVGRHEVPDSERFDFILRKDTGEPIFVCTDLHWSETWGEVPEPPLRVRLGLSRKTIMEEVSKGLAGAASSAIKAPARWIGLLKKDGKAVEADEPYNPLDFVRDRAAARHKTDSLNQVRDKGSEAHVPQLPDDDLIEYFQSRFGSKRNMMVSNDVRKVFD